MKRYFILIIILSMVMFSLAVQANAAETSVLENQQFVITIDGNIIDFSNIGEPMLSSTGRTFIPLRFMSKYLAYNGYYPENSENNALQNVWINDVDTMIEFTLNKSVALVNGEEVFIDHTPEGEPSPDTKPYLYDNKVYLPLRFLCETFGEEKIDYKKIGDVHHIAITTNIQYGNTIVQDDSEEIQTLAGHMIIKDNAVYFNEVEIIEWENQDRIKELGLKENDMPEGYIIISKNKDTMVFELSDKAKFTFTDVNHLFVKKYEGNVLYTTAELEEFLEHLGVYKLNDIPLLKQTIPYFIEVKDGKIISITEEFKYTI